MENTEDKYLLIPVKDIIELHEYPSMIALYNSDVANGLSKQIAKLRAAKQISLPEIDIHDKAEDSWHLRYIRGLDTGTFHDGYKQALLDILK